MIRAMSASLRVGQRVPGTEAEGPFLRSAIWLSGCSLRCPGCCNPELFSAAAGSDVTVERLVQELAQARSELGIEGLTVLGGEPLEQMPGLIALCEGARALDLGVIVFSGFREDEARSLARFTDLCDTIDTLVDGRFDARRPESTAFARGRRWVGSSNQNLVHYTERYADPAYWQGPDHAELRIAPDGSLSAHGSPGEVLRLLRSLRSA